MAMIEIEHVSKWYGEHFQVLKDCTASVEKGEVVVVCGPSGSGKSTLIKTVNGLEPFQEGKIIVRVALVNGQLLQILHLTDVFDILCRQLHLPQAEVSVI